MAGKLKALICDSDSGWIAHHKDALKSLGYEVVGVATDAEGAVRIAQETQPDVVVTSLFLPYPSDAFLMMHTISRLTKNNARFVIVSSDPQVCVLPKRDWDPTVFAKMVTGS